VTLALVFDLDGVIVDSNPVHEVAWREYAGRFGVTLDGGLRERMYGKRNDEIVRDFFGDDLSAEEVAARGRAKEALYREMIGERLEEMLVPGVRAFLDRHQGAPIALASNAEPENVNFLLDRAGLRRYFHAVVDGHQVSRPKPDPGVYIRAAGILGVDPARAVVFEDTPAGVEAGISAGMTVIGLRTTYVNLPGTAFSVDNFLSGELEQWLEAKMRMG